MRQKVLIDGWLSRSANRPIIIQVVFGSHSSTAVAYRVRLFGTLTPFAGRLQYVSLVASIYVLERLLSYYGPSLSMLKSLELRPATGPFEMCVNCAIFTCTSASNSTWRLCYQNRAGTTLAPVDTYRDDIVVVPSPKFLVIIQKCPLLEYSSVEVYRPVAASPMTHSKLLSQFVIAGERQVISACLHSLTLPALRRLTIIFTHVIRFAACLQM